MRAAGALRREAGTLARVSHDAEYAPGAPHGPLRHDTSCVRAARPSDGGAILRMRAERQGVDPESLRSRVAAQVESTPWRRTFVADLGEEQVALRGAMLGPRRARVRAAQ